MQKLRTINTEEINKLIERYNRGEKITRTENIFHQNQIGTLNSKFAFTHTHTELQEYVKCANSITYFIEQYTGIKLRKYQVEWIETFNTKRFIINMVSRQCGNNTIYSLILLHYMIFNIDKKISIISYKGQMSVELINLIYKAYLKIPYFLKPAILSNSKNSIKFNNGSQVKKIYNTYEKSDIVFYLDFAFINPKVLSKIYVESTIDIVSNKDTKMIITSTPNGKNILKNIVEDSERKEGDPMKNLFVTTRTYWWEVEGRDQQWKQDRINDMGGNIDWFNQEYDLKFISK